MSAFIHQVKPHRRVIRLNADVLLSARLGEGGEVWVRRFSEAGMLTEGIDAAFDLEHPHAAHDPSRWVGVARQRLNHLLQGEAQRRELEKPEGWNQGSLPVPTLLMVVGLCWGAFSLAPLAWALAIFGGFGVLGVGIHHQWQVSKVEALSIGLLKQQKALYTHLCEGLGRSFVIAAGPALVEHRPHLLFLESRIADLDAHLDGLRLKLRRAHQVDQPAIEGWIRQAVMLRQRLHHLRDEAEESLRIWHLSPGPTTTGDLGIVPAEVLRWVRQLGVEPSGRDQSLRRLWGL